MPRASDRDGAWAIVMDINISNLPKNKVLRALFNASRQQGIGLLDPSGRGQMTDDEAGKWIDSNQSRYFDYLKGRVVKVALDGDSFCPALFNRDNGDEAAERAIDHLRAELA